MTLNIDRDRQTGDVCRVRINMNCQGGIASAKALHPPSLVVYPGEEFLFQLSNVFASGRFSDRAQ